MLGTSVVGSVGALFLKIGAGRLKGSLASVIINWRLMMGVAFYLFSSVVFVLGVRKGELSVLYPMVSLGSVWTLSCSNLVLGAPFARAKFVGAVLCPCGVALLGPGARARPWSQYRPPPVG